MTAAGGGEVSASALRGGITIVAAIWLAIAPLGEQDPHEILRQVSALS